MDVQQAVLAGLLGHGHFREVHGRQGGAAVGVAHELLGHFQADVGLRFQRGAADVRGQDDVLEAAQGRFENLVVGLGLLGEHVDGSAVQVLALDGVSKGVDVHAGAAGGIDEDGALLHLGELLGAHHVLGGGQFRHMQGDHVGGGQQLVHGADLAGIAQRQLGDDVIVDHGHAERFGNHR